MSFKAGGATAPERNCKRNRCLGSAVPVISYLEKDMI